LTIAASKQEEQPITKPFEGSQEITIGKNKFNPYQMDSIILNTEQKKAVDWFGIEGRSGCLIGPAGTGKTTTMRAIIRAMILSGRIPIIPNDETHKYLCTGLPGIFGGSFTRIATRNLRDNTPSEKYWIKKLAR
jgi:ABC-type oligopeptide transport system ATPase subunit